MGAEPGAGRAPPRGNAASRSLERFESLLRRHGGMILALVALATVGFALALLRLDVSNPPSKYQLPPDDPVALEMERFKELFGADDQVAIAFDYGRPVELADLEGLRRIEAALRDLPGVVAVTLPAGLDDPVLLGRDRNAMLAVLELQHTAGAVGAEAAHGPFLDELTRLLDQHPGEFIDYHLAGLPLIDRAFETHLRRDLRSFSLLGIVVAILLLHGLYRQRRAVLVGGGAALASLVWSLGMVSLAGTPLSIGVAMMIPLILMLSVAYSAHYLSHWLGSPEEPTAALAGMLRAVLPPSLLTGVATAAGFFALNASGIEGLRDVGTHFGLGAIAAALLNATAVPVLLYRFVPPGGSAGGRRLSALPARAAGWLRRLVLGRSLTVIAIAVVVTAVSLAGLRFLRVDSNHLAYFDRDTRVWTDYSFVDENFGGMVPVEVLVPVSAVELGPSMERLAAFTADLREVEGIGRVVSPQELAEGAGFAAPSALLWRHMATLEGPDRYVRARDDDLLFRISAGAYIQGSDGLSRVLGQVRALSDDAFAGNATLTGLMPLFVRTMDHIVRGQAASFAIAFSVIALLFLLVADSPRTGLFAVTANLLPILAVLGFMGWAGVPVDFGTAMIASVLIGIAVHDTVHVLFRLRRERSGGARLDAALAATFQAVGPPVVVSTIVFCGGLMILSLSDFAPVRHFGLLSCAVMATAFLADLLLLPALVAFAERRA